MEIYNINEHTMSRIPETDVQYEENLEQRLTKTQAATIGGVEILYLGRQGTTEHGKQYDIVGVDEDGNLVVVESKKGETPRGVIAQALDYTSRLRQHEYSDLQTEYNEFLSKHGYADDNVQRLQDAHQDHFDLADPLSKEEFNSDQRIVVIGATIDNATTNMADYLRDRGDIDVVLVEYTVYQDEDENLELLTTNAIRRPLEDEPAAKSEKSLSEKQERRKDFWNEFQTAHQEQGLPGTGVNESASYGIYVFTSGRRNRPAYIRPKVGYDGAYNAIRFYEGARQIPKDTDLRQEFEATVDQVASELATDSELRTDLPTNMSDEYDFMWDTEEVRDREFDLVTISYENSVHDEFRDEETLSDIQDWLIDTSQVFKQVLLELEDEGYISTA